MKGWVYVITNKAMPGLVKVGFSMKDPEIRANELNHTGTPHPYVVEYEVLIDSPRDIEQSIHKLLQANREGKEWFRCSPEDAVAAIQTVVGSCALLENYKRVDRWRAEAIRLQKKIEDTVSKAQKAQAAANVTGLVVTESIKLAKTASENARGSAQKSTAASQKAVESAKIAQIASKKWFRSQFHEHTSFWNRNARNVDWEGKDGFGIAAYSDGCRYEGQWQNNKREGFGVLIYPNGRRQEGEWRNDS